MITISSKENDLIKSIKKLLTSKGQRNDSGLFALEGLRLCEDAVLSNVLVEHMLISDSIINKHKESIEKIAQKAVKTYIVKDSIINYLSDTKTPQGVICVCKQTVYGSLTLNDLYNRKFIMLERIQDPSNMGTILRTAEALGIGSVIFSDDCCDVYSPKVLRGSMGAVFRLKLFKSLSLLDDINFLQYNKITCIASVPDSSAISIKDIETNGSFSVAIGNEGNGLNENTIKACNIKATIPMNGKAQSLNASMAAGIIMWELMR